MDKFTLVCLNGQFFNVHYDLGFLSQNLLQFSHTKVEAVYGQL